MSRFIDCARWCFAALLPVLVREMHILEPYPKGQPGALALAK